jgi:soluble lytic murein transglycosylase-like protein
VGEVVTPYRQLIELLAKGYDLDPNLVEAVVIAESSGCTDAFRFEPAFFTRYLQAKPEYANQNPRRVSSSYGLCQVMYTTAQEHGYSGLPEGLFVPDVGLRYGCLHLRKVFAWAGGDTRKALAAYNGGQGNWNGTEPQRYAVRVLKLYDSVKAAQK